MNPPRMLHTHLRQVCGQRRAFMRDKSLHLGSVCRRLHNSERMFWGLQSGSARSDAWRAVDPDLNGGATAGCLCWVDVATRLSVHHYRPFIRGCFGGPGAQAAGSEVARLRLPAGVPAAAEQQRFRSTSRRTRCGVWRARTGVPGTSTGRPTITAGRRTALFRPARLLRRPLQWRQLWSVLDADADRAGLELRLIGRRGG